MIAAGRLAVRAPRRALPLAVVALAFCVPASALASSPASSPSISGTDSISGTVTEPQGQPLNGASVTVSSVGQSAQLRTATAPDGTYSFSGLANGIYTVSFSALGYLTQYYQGAASAGSAKHVTLASGVMITGVDAQLQLAGAISGAVTDAGGAPLANMQVSVLDAAGFVAGAETASDGTYTVGSLPAGAYSVKFAPAAPVAGFSPGGGNYLPQFYNRESSSKKADNVIVVGGKPTTGIDAQLSTGGTISGQVLDQADAPVDGLLVSAYAANGEVAGSWFTEADGRYSIDQLPSGSYAVGFRSSQAHSLPNDLPQFYAGRAKLAGANAVAVTAGSDTEINEHVAVGGQVKGSVTDGKGAGIEDARVLLFDGSGEQVAEAQTGSEGAYTIDALESGPYFAEFMPPVLGLPPSSGGGNFLPTFFNGKGSLASANAVAVTVGATTAGVDGALAEGGELTGTVTGTGGTALPNVSVTAYGAAGTALATVLTGSNGTYTLGGLTTGSYRVGFRAESARPLVPGPGNYAPQFDGGASSLAAAAPVAVSVGAAASVVEAQLQPGASISGTVTGPGGEAVGGEGVSAYDESGTFAGSATTAGDGSYTIADLSAGSYRVEFKEEVSGPDRRNYAPQFFESEPNLAAAKAVSVPAGEGVAGVDAQLTAGGTIAGTVTDASGLPLVGEVSVDVYDESGQTVASGIVEPNGTYSVGALIDGTYRVSVQELGSGEGYSKQFFGGTSLASATGVPVTGGATIANINVQLSRVGGTIEGTVTGGAGCGTGARVTVYDASGTAIASVSTAADGSYTVPGLQPGFYRVGFSAGGCTGDFYGGAATLTQAGAILVLADATAEGIDEQLSPLGGTGTPTPELTPTASSPLISTVATTPKSGVAGTRVVFLVFHVMTPPTQAQKLAKALAACGKLKKSKRAKCVAAAKKRYPSKKAKAKAKAKRKR